MSLATTGTYHTISPPLSGAMKDFHNVGPAAANALLPKVLYVRVTTYVRLAVECSRRSQALATRQLLLATYDDVNSIVTEEDRLTNHIATTD